MSIDPDYPSLDEEWKPTPRSPLIIKGILIRLSLAVILFTTGLGSGYLLWGRKDAPKVTGDERLAYIESINPKGGIKIHGVYGDIGPKLIAAGAIDAQAFSQLYEKSYRPLSGQELEILNKGSKNQIVITRENSQFLLNFFWALGLANKNPILENGPIKKGDNGKIERFASTGGWTLAKIPIKDLFSSTTILSLSADQQARVEEVARAVFRPCCNNATLFPDCNHGMAMLGLLELMASQDATTDEMFLAAKQVNAFWFPQQTLEQAIYFKAAQNIDYARVDARLILGREFSSSSGFQKVHAWLADNDYLEKTSGSGNKCGV